MKNIHILPTDKPSRLLQSLKVMELLDKEWLSPIGNVNRNIYITSDEEIKEGDWMIRGNEQPIKVTKDFFWDFGVRYYKIILTTDKDLIGVQAIDDEFLEWFVKNPSCEEVKVDLVPINEFGSEITVNGYGFDKFKYKINIPKEETQGYICPQTKLQCDDEFCVSAEKCNLLPSTDVFSEPKQKIDMSKYTIGIDPYDKQETTLEEVAERLSELQEGTYTPQHKITYKHGFEDGAKWKEERMYSEEEVLQLLLRLQQTESYNNLYDWFEQFKKK